MKNRDILLLGKTQEEREAFNALPTSEKVRITRQERVADLLRVGYISKAEAETYRQQLTELPQDRKGLVVAYYLKSRISLTPSMETTARIEEVIASFHLSERGALRDGKTIADTLTGSELNRWVEELTTIHIQEGIKRAETFVDAKRKRIRGKLLKFACLEVASAINEPEPQGEDYDTIPYLRELLQEKGYRANAKSLNDGDRTAIQEAALHYLDLLELCFLNGIGVVRYEEYRGYQNEEQTEWTKELLYRDVYDEALTEFEDMYLLLEVAITNFYEDGTAKEAIDFLSRFFKALSGKGSEDYKELQGGKFSCYLEEAKE